MIVNGQFYHKDGKTYELKAHLIKTFHMTATLVNVEDKENTIDFVGTVTGFVSQFSKVPDAGIELIKDKTS